jgi:hypothetical protein
MNNSVELINTDVNVLAKIDLLNSDWEDVLSLSAILENNELKNFDILLVEYNENALFQFKSFDEISKLKTELIKFLNDEISEINFSGSNNSYFKILKTEQVDKFNLNKIKIVVTDSDTTTEIEELSVFYIKDIVLNINSFLEYKNSL